MRISAVQRKRRLLAQAPAGLSVAIAGPHGQIRQLGSPQAALKSRELTAGEKQAIRGAQWAMQYLQSKYAGFADAGHGVTLLLRSAEAQRRGPFISSRTISVPSTNPLQKGSGTVLPPDVALHEMTHAVQLEVAKSTKSLPHAGLAEGLADAQAMLATRDWRIGEAYFARSGKKKVARTYDAVRIVQGAGRGYESVVSSYRDVAGNRVESHRAGGVASRTLLEFSKLVGVERAEQLLAYVVADQSAWAQGGSWAQFARSMIIGAGQLWPNDPQAMSAVRAALRATQLDEALPYGAASGVNAAAPALPGA